MKSKACTSPIREQNLMLMPSKWAGILQFMASRGKYFKGIIGKYLPLPTIQKTVFRGWQSDLNAYV